MKRLIFILAACVSTIATLQAQQAQTVTIDKTNVTTYLEPYSETSSRFKRGWSSLFTVKDHPDLRNAKKIIIAANLSELPNKNLYRDFYYNHKGTNPYTYDSDILANLEELELEAGHYIRDLWVWGTSLKKLTINDSNPTDQFRCLSVAGSFLTEDDIILGDNVKFDQLHLHRNKITTLSKFYTRFKAPTAGRTAGLYCNGDAYNRSFWASVDDGTYNPTNTIREIDMTGIPSDVSGFQFKYNLLEHLDAGSHTNIKNIQVQYNLLWSLNLENVPASLTPADGYNVSPQKPYADLWVEKGTNPNGSEDEVWLKLPTEQNSLFDGARVKPGSVKLNGNLIATQALQHDGTQNYFKVIEPGTQTADLDLYEKHNGFSYEYDHRPNLGDSEKRYMNVQVKTYPYIMYVNPATKSGSGVDYYSGTLWLDYHSIVPEGTTVWIATGIKRDSMDVGSAQAGNQLVLEQIGGPGDVIPAGTAMYVRSKTKAGLYAFQKAWKHELLGWDNDTLVYNKDLTDVQAQLDQQIAKIGNRNILVGSGEETTVGAYSTLTLGRESKKGTRMIGFWPYTGTKIAAHRCYITDTKYKELVEGLTPSPGAAKGVTFYFEELPETTGIHSIDNGQRTIADDAWYSIDGKRLNAKPTQKGLYIHNGRKEAVL